MPSPIPPGAPRHAQAAYLLARVGGEQSARFAGRLGGLGLRPKHFALLNAIALAGGLSQQELGRRLRLDPSGLVGSVDELEAMGLVARRRDETDRRRYAIDLTAEGTATLRRARRLVSDGAREVLAPLGDADIDTLVGLLERVAAGLGDDARSESPTGGTSARARARRAAPRRPAP